MILYLRAQNYDELVLGFFDGRKKSLKIVKAVPEKYLAAIISYLNANQSSLDQLAGMIVITGPGSFTAVRTLISVANAVVYQRQLPAIGIKNVFNLPDEQLFARALNRFMAEDIGSCYLEPYYDQAPNISRPKARF